MVHRHGVAPVSLGMYPILASRLDPASVQQEGDIGFWVWISIIAVLAFALLIWLLLSRARRRRPEHREVIAHARPAADRAQEPIRMATPLPAVATDLPGGGASPPVSVQALAPEAAPAPPDDLRVVEGIGPKIAGILQDAGITTLAELAAAEVDRLAEIVQEAGLRALADPTTWPEQARLAAGDKWDELAALQDKLKGGRRE